MTDRNHPRNKRHAFSREEKVALVLVVVLGISGLFLGTRYIQKNLAAPFQITSDGSGRLLTTDQQEAAELEDKKTRDTDNDGLTDYDEEFLYGSSPYLADSDSDGFSDATEIASGNDPICPTGQECYGGVAAADTYVDQVDQLLDGLEEPQFDLEAAEQQFEDAQIQDEGDLEETLGSLTIDEIRQALLESGMDPLLLDQLSDDELQGLYDEVLAEYIEAQG